MIDAQNSSESFLALLSETIKELRIESGYGSYETFALDNNLDRKQYWRIESGSNITMKTLKKILDLHGISFSDFFLKLEEKSKQCSKTYGDKF